MTKTTQAILASAFVFPGIGQVLLTRYFLAVSLMAAALWATIVIFNYIFTTASAISKRILSGEIEPDVFLIRELIFEQQANASSSIVNTAIWVLITVWLISVFDAYRAGRVQEKSANSIKS